jgi:hypothetical protein
MLLIAVCSCHKDRDVGCHDSIRRSWGRVALEAGIDVRFFLGGRYPANLEADETWVPVPDDYLSLPHKTKAIAQCSLIQGYDYLFKCDNDTFLVPKRLLQCGFEDFDYYGTPVNKIYLNGGPGYFLSKRAAEIVAASEVDEQAEDRWVGRMLGDRVLRGDAGEKFWRYSTWHYPVGMYGPKRYHPESQWQETMARAYLDGTEGLDPRGLCFQDRAENGIMVGEFKILLRFPGREDVVKVVSREELTYWKGRKMVREILTPRW